MLNVQLSDQAQWVINAVPPQERKRLEASIEYLSGAKARMHRQYVLDDIQERVVRIDDYYIFFITDDNDNLIIEDFIRAKNFEALSERDLTKIPHVSLKTKPNRYGKTSRRALINKSWQVIHHHKAKGKNLIKVGGTTTISSREVPPHSKEHPHSHGVRTR